MQFSKTFLLEYRFEEIQALKFIVLDVDDKKHVDDIGRHDLIGNMECTLADIVTAGQQYKRTLRDKGEWAHSYSLLVFNLVHVCVQVCLHRTHGTKIIIIK